VEQENGQENTINDDDISRFPTRAGQNEDDYPSNDDDIDDDSNNDSGRFISNSRIDEGVVLIAKLQHGASVDERAQVPGTRSRRSAVKVICVARCPYGGHFATGSDDGICRIWKDDDDEQVERVDHYLNERQGDTLPSRHTFRKSRRYIFVSNFFTPFPIIFYPSEQR
jgi:WD40 repeat protein